MQRTQDHIFLFVYALAGFGHLRVTDALLHGLDPKTPRYLYDSKEWSLIATHRIMSIHPIARRLMEWVQTSSVAEHYFTRFYRTSLTSYPHNVYKEIMAYLSRKHVKTHHIVVIATHFGLAHQMSVAKGIFRQHGIDLTIVVQVTDDSPQSIWYVPGADYTFVPSIETKQALEKYGQRNHLARTKIIVSPYPVSPLLALHLDKASYIERKKQYKAEENTEIHVAVPISGAAVGLEYYEHLFPKLHALSKRFCFHVIAKDTIYTHPFLKKMSKLSYVELHSDKTDHGVVSLYEKVFARHVIGFEITKPSEQAFKAMLSTKATGGATLLFSHPVGRQEHDNLKFLRKHSLIPTHEEQKHMWKKSEHLTEECCKQIQGWRGVLLPKGSTATARFIHHLLVRDVYTRMMEKEKEIETSDELSEHGVAHFWSTVNSLLTKTKQ